MVAERIALMHVGDVYFIQRQVDGGHRIADGDGGVCPCGGVEDNRIRFATAGLNTVDEIPFMIGLEKFDSCAAAFTGLVLSRFRFGPLKTAIL